ncbi:MAG: hypothetical protein KDI27_11250 [Gammaproteobacteria bacterium]|nr:hypothetical protein [Gammaproteobacteria bacterium]MCB1852352.1 hypothetical protein [Gammaproteobacteria bacterium]MCP5416059.1 hypothetical protein [Chromatiaceae bacterium]
MFDRRTLFAIGWSCLLCLATVSPASADQTRGIHSLPGQHSLDSTDFVKTDYRYHPDYRPRPDLHQPKHAHRTPPRHWDGYRPPGNHSHHRYERLRQRHDHDFINGLLLGGFLGYFIGETY